MNATPDSEIWGFPDRPVELLARNVSTRYVAIFIDGVIGLLLLPFNVSHLGPAAYGLWALTTSVTWFFGVLDLGYGSALVKFIAQYRAWRDRRALNEIVSTIGLLFTGLGAVTLIVTAFVAWHIEWFFNLQPGQARTAQQILLLTGAYLSIQFAFSIFGAVVYAFQRYYRNNIVSIATSLTVAFVNVLILNAGHGLVTLVAATTVVRVIAFGFFARNAVVAFPGLQLSLSLVRWARLKEVTGFSVYMVVLDWSAKLNYSADALVIGAMLNTTAVALWTVGQRIAQMTQRLTNQLNDGLFPVVVDSDAAQRPDRLQLILIEGSKLSLALAAPLCLGLIVFAGVLIERWVGSQFEASIIPAQLMLAVVIVRASTASANLILRGAGEHRLLAYTNATAAIVNVVLSVLLIRPLGLIGVALGTLIPVSASTLFVLYPAACRRVNLPVGRCLIRGIWPSLWPACIMVAMWGIVPRPTTLGELAADMIAGGLLYLGLFVGVAVGRQERRFYWTKLQRLVLRQARTPAPV
jgi:O-antigen/teichoic acid export membrane protein